LRARNSPWPLPIAGIDNWRANLGGCIRTRKGEGKTKAAPGERGHAPLKRAARQKQGRRLTRRAISFVVKHFETNSGKDVPLSIESETNAR
jgi:hypothetical protein